MIPFDGNLNDIPPAAGGWRVTVKEVLADGAEKPLLIKVTSGSNYAEAVDVPVKSSEFETCFAPPLTFTRSAP